MGNGGIDYWYAVFCKPRQEAVAEENLRRQDFQVYLPRTRIRHRRRGHWVSAIEAFFPRYLFIRMNTFRRSTVTIHSTRGVVGLVRFGREPAVVPDVVMNALLQREDSACGLHPDNRPAIRAGDQIKLVDGPLTGIEGIFAHEDSEQRVTVLLELLGKANKISVSRDWVASAA